MVVVRGAHRGPAFDAVRYGIDEVKRRVPIWKEEFYGDGTRAYVQGCAIA
jgi:molybdopterin synthase catalytic subunit